MSLLNANNIKINKCWWRHRQLEDVHFLSLHPSSLHAAFWTGVVSIYPVRAVAGLCRLHSHLIACHMKSFVFCHRGSTGDQYCQRREWGVCMCEWERGETNEFEYLRGKGSFEGCSSITVILSPGVHRREGLMCTCAHGVFWHAHPIWYMHAVTHCLPALPSAGLKSGWTLAGKPH